MKDFKIILIAFLAGVSVFSAFRYVSSLRQQHMLQLSLEEKSGEVSALQDEKQNLLQDIGKEKELNQKIMRMNTLLEDNLKAGKNRLSRLFSKYDRAVEDNERLSSEVSILKAENAAVRQDSEKLRLELMQIGQENEILNARFNSVDELKKAIRELRGKKNTAGASVEIRKIEVKKKHSEAPETAGNCGYVIKDGVPFAAPAQVKIEVSPASEE